MFFVYANLSDLTLANLPKGVQSNDANRRVMVQSFALFDNPNFHTLLVIYYAHLHGRSAVGAVLCRAVLNGAVLCCAVLTGAVLCCAGELRERPGKQGRDVACSWGCERVVAGLLRNPRKGDRSVQGNL